MNEAVDKISVGTEVLFPYNGNKYWLYDYNFCMIYYRKDLYQQEGPKIRTIGGVRETPRS